MNKFKVDDEVRLKPEFESMKYPGDSAIIVDIHYSPEYPNIESRSTMLILDRCIGGYNLHYASNVEHIGLTIEESLSKWIRRNFRVESDFKAKNYAKALMRDFKINRKERHPTTGGELI